MTRDIIVIRQELVKVNDQIDAIDDLFIQVAKGGERWSLRDGDSYREVWRSDLPSIMETRKKLIAYRKELTEELAQAQGLKTSSRVKCFRGC